MVSLFFHSHFTLLAPMSVCNLSRSDSSRPPFALPLIPMLGMSSALFQGLSGGPALPKNAWPLTVSQTALQPQKLALWSGAAS